MTIFELPGGVVTNDPHLPKLRKMLATVQEAVKAGEMTPRVGNAIMQQYADSLAAKQR